AVLGGGVGRDVGGGHRAVDRRHVDDRAPTGVEHRRDLRPHPVQHAVEVDVDHPVPVAQGDLAYRRPFATDPGSAGRALRGAVLVGGLLHHTRGGTGSGGVVLRGVGAAAVGPDLSGDLPGGVEVDVGDQHGGAVPGQIQAHGPA